MECTCSNCNAVLAKKNKSYRRIDLNSNLPRSNVSAAEVLSTEFGIDVLELSKSESVYLCIPCAQLLAKITSKVAYTESGKAFQKMCSSAVKIGKQTRQSTPWKTPRLVKRRKIATPKVKAPKVMYMFLLFK